MLLAEVFTASLLLLAAVQHSASGAARSEIQWQTSWESLADYEVARSHSVPSRIHCTGAASRDAMVQLVKFHPNSGLCIEFKCRLGLRHCRKCRDAGRGDQLVWTNNKDCWTTVQHRVSGSVNFYRTWTDYKQEFGEGPDGNYWIGLNKLRDLTNTGQIKQLRFLMKLWNGTESWAQYSSFIVGPESDLYRLTVSGFSASKGVGDSMAAHNGCQFSTKDADHDRSAANCAQKYVGAWWFAGCHNTHPNGEYKDFSAAIGGAYAQGIIWNFHFGYWYSLKEIEMLIL